MNTNTGETYGLREPVGTYLSMAQLAGRDVNFEEARRRAGGTLLEEEARAVRAVRAGDPVVEVAGHVAQAQRLGQRELERRARRRKASKQARKRNR